MQRYRKGESRATSAGGTYESDLTGHAQADGPREPRAHLFVVQHAVHVAHRHPLHHDQERVQAERL